MRPVGGIGRRDGLRIHWFRAMQVRFLYRTPSKNGLRVPEMGTLGGFYYPSQGNVMDTTFKPYKIHMVTVMERYQCGRDTKRNGRGKPSVFYLCKCDCGKEFILSGNEVIRHPYSCGCQAAPDYSSKRTNESSLSYVGGTMLNMIKPTRAVYSDSSSGVSGVQYVKNRNRWRATLTFQQKRHYLGEFKTKEAAITARIEAERKYYDPFLAEHGITINDGKCQKAK
jgi:hypothetical protein